MLIGSLILQVVLIALNAVFAAAEIAIISMNDARLASLASKGDKKAVRLARLTSSPAKFLATIQVAITLSGFMGSAFAADNFSEPLVNFLIEKCGINASSRGTLSSVAVVVITLILSYFTLVFGELVPKRYAMKKAESLALGISGLISFISKVFTPIVWFLSVSTNGVLRLLGIDPNEQEEAVTEEEIRMMIDSGSEKGTIDKEEKELILNVFEFDDRSADEIATHRTEIDLLWAEDTDETWKTTLYESRHTFFPICSDSVDNIIGVLNAKDYFRLADKSRENVMKHAVKRAYFVPESVRADVLFANMKKEHSPFAIVLDEYGGMSGIVTMTDILESIVGEYDEDEDDKLPDTPDIVKKEDGLWLVSGDAPVEDAEEALGIHIGDEEYDTFGGYVLSLLGVVPSDGETPVCETDELIIKTTKVLEHRIGTTEVRKKTESGETTVSR